jgi:hypothetical protein
LERSRKLMVERWLSCAFLGRARRMRRRQRHFNTGEAEALAGILWLFPCSCSKEDLTLAKINVASALSATR